MNTDIARARMLVGIKIAEQRGGGRRTGGLAHPDAEPRNDQLAETARETGQARSSGSTRTRRRPE